MRTAVYACGEGFGHLTRTRAVLHTLTLDPDDTPVLVRGDLPADVGAGLTVVALPDADDPFSREGRRHLGAGLRAVLEDLAVDRLIVDAFPAGLRGEIDGGAVPSGVVVDHVARLLRWPVYEPLLPEDPPALRTVWCTEPLHEPHRRWLGAHAAEVRALALVDPPAPAAPPAPRRDGRPRWVVVHAGPARETSELVAFALETAAAEGYGAHAIDLVLVTPTAARPASLPAGIRHVDTYPATSLLVDADRIVTAAGFNAVRQAAPYADRHLVLPFERRYDDQFERARRVRARSRRGA